MPDLAIDDALRMVRAIRRDGDRGSARGRGSNGRERVPQLVAEHREEVVFRRARGLGVDSCRALTTSSLARSSSARRRSDHRRDRQHHRGQRRDEGREYQKRGVRRRQRERTRSAYRAPGRDGRQWRQWRATRSAARNGTRPRRAAGWSGRPAACDSARDRHRRTSRPRTGRPARTASRSRSASRRPGVGLRRSHARTSGTTSKPPERSPIHHVSQIEVNWLHGAFPAIASVVTPMVAEIAAVGAINATKRKIVGARSSIRRPLAQRSMKYAPADASSTLPTPIASAVPSVPAVTALIRNAATKMSGRADGPSNSTPAIAMPVGGQMGVALGWTNARESPSFAAARYATNSARNAKDRRMYG